MAMNPDQTWHSPLLCIWSAVEMNVAIVCSCAPTLRCLIQRFWPKFLSSVMSNYGSGRRSDREDSEATAVNSNSNMSKNSSVSKSGNISQVEAGMGGKKQSSSRLKGFRSSFSKTLSGNRSRSNTTCDDDNGSAIDLNPYPTGSPKAKMSSQHGRDIEVEVEVVQTIDTSDGDYSKPSEWKPC